MHKFFVNTIVIISLPVHFLFSQKIISQHNRFICKPITNVTTVSTVKLAYRVDNIKI